MITRCASLKCRSFSWKIRDYLRTMAKVLLFKVSALAFHILSTQFFAFPTFWIFPMALKPSEMACQVTFNGSTIICCVCVSCLSNNACSSWSWFWNVETSVHKSWRLEQNRHKSQQEFDDFPMPYSFDWTRNWIITCHKCSLFGSKFEMFNTKKKYASYSWPTFWSGLSKKQNGSTREQNICSLVRRIYTGAPLVGTPILGTDYIGDVHSARRQLPVIFGTSVRRDAIGNESK